MYNVVTIYNHSALQHRQLMTALVKALVKKKNPPDMEKQVKIHDSDKKKKGRKKKLIFSTW